MAGEPGPRDDSVPDGADTADDQVPDGWWGVPAALRGAVAFLTVVPVGRAAPPGRGALIAFPAAGLVVGAVCALAGWTAGTLWGGMVAAAAVLVADLLVTGGLHLDALADTADGVGSRQPPRQMLDVMRDPRIGGVGAATLGGALLVRFALLAVLLDAQGGWLLAAVAPVTGRVAMVWALGTMPAGEGSLAAGPGSAATLPVRITTMAVGGLLSGVVAASAGALGGTTSVAAGPAGLAALAAAAVVLAVVIAEAAGRWWRRRVGLASGDAVGAAGLLAETAVLALLAV